MPYNFDEGRILGELNDLEEEIKLLYRLTVATKVSEDKTLSRTIERLKKNKERLESRLNIHRQKVKESGVKY